MEATSFVLSQSRQFRVQSFLRCPNLREQGSAVVQAVCQRRSQHIGPASRWLHSAQETWRTNGTRIGHLLLHFNDSCTRTYSLHEDTVKYLINKNYSSVEITIRCSL